MSSTAYAVCTGFRLTARTSLADALLARRLDGDRETAPHSIWREVRWAVLVGYGIDARFLRRGPDGDVITVPAQEAVRARRLLDALGR
jgi:hypothetical protein